MTASHELLIDLAGVARLADVRRPVASVWRSRHASTADPFPPAVAQKAGRPYFDPIAVAQWLARTGRGNNPQAVADAAASAVPGGFDVAEGSHVASVDALLALHAASDELCGGVPTRELEDRAGVVDPDDACLASEIVTALPSWAEWADQLADAAYSPAGASTLLERRHASTTAAAGTAGAWTATASDLVVAVVEAMAQGRRAQLILEGGIAPSFAVDLVTRLGDDLDIVVPPSRDGRAIRRRLLCEALPAPASRVREGDATLHVVRLPSRGGPAALDMLRTVDELALGLGDPDRALVIAPAGLLTDPLTAGAARSRADVLRTGLVRAIVRLPAGLVVAAPRQALALWVLGRETGDVAIADRFTAVADLTQQPLSPSSIDDLASDIVAALGGRRDRFAHAFRFAGLVRTSSLIAADTSLVARATRDTMPRQAAAELPALIDQAHRRLGPDAPAATVQSDGAAVPPAAVADLLADGHVRVVAGTRLDPDELSRDGYVIVGIDELDDPTRIGTRRAERMSFATRHPSASLTAAGDVVFRTGPTPRAWVDRDGSKVVEYPARVLRIDRADPGGLVADLVAVDIARAPGGPGSWRRWRLRRVPPNRRGQLQAALADLSERREALQERLDALDEYTDILSAGVVAGVVIPPDQAAPAASDQK